MSKDEIDEIKRELEEQKKRNEEMSKLLQEVYKKLDSTSKIDLEEEKEKTSQKDIYPKMKTKSNLERGTKSNKYVHRIGSRKLNTERTTEIDEFQEKIQQIIKKAEKIATEGLKTTTKISEKLNKNIQKILERETAKITKATKISKVELDEINHGIENMRDQIESYQEEVEDARAKLNQARIEVRETQRRLERASIRGDRKEMERRRLELIRAIENLNTHEKEIMELRTELIQLKREFARLQRRALKIHEMQSKKSSPHVVRINDIDVEGTVSEYITRVLDSVGKNLEATFRSAFKDRTRAFKSFILADDDKERREKVQDTKERIDKSSEDFFTKSSILLSALGDENRLKILKILEESPQYQKELSEITELKGGSFKHHTDILQNVEFITREAVRGRYLITQLGIEALKLAEMIYFRKKQLEEETEIDISIED
ncbi:MAG: ArsR family transcriptional regulator [Candidatus Heimdallarchaeaceae archaeon]